MRLANITRGLATTGLVAAATLLAAGQIVCAAPSLEYAVKATYLYKFAPFIEWPSAVFSSADSPIVICVSGRDPFGQVLDQAVAGQHVAGRSVLVRRMAQFAPNSGCQIAFVGGSGEQSVAQGLTEARGEPVLTVTDCASDPASRGIVCFVIADNRVRFEIDARAAEQNGISISSKLLSLALQPKTAK